MHAKIKQIKKGVLNGMSFKDAILFDMNFIIKEIDTIDNEELEKIYKLSQRFVRDLGRELTERCGYEDEF